MAACIAPARGETGAGAGFAMNIRPGTLTLIPGKPASFVVSLTPLNGFASVVQLSAGGLPAGITAAFNPASVLPPGTSVLTLTAANDAALGTFQLNLTGVGGGLTNQTVSGPVTVNFGLIPKAYGSFAGVVTDIETGLPIVRANVTAGGGQAYTDATGHFSIQRVALGADNAPTSYSVRADGATASPAYWSSTIWSYAVADSPTEVNFQLLRQKSGVVEGDVMDPDHNPVPGAKIYFGSGGVYNWPVATSDTNGVFQPFALALDNNNAPRPVTLHADKDGYWSDIRAVTVTTPNNAVVHFVLVPYCIAIVAGRVVYADTGEAVTNRLVTFGGSAATARTDSAGYYSIPGASLDLRYGSATCTIAVSSERSNQTAGGITWWITNCAATIEAPLVTMPREYSGGLALQVLDDVSGTAITNARVWIPSNTGWSSGDINAYPDGSGAFVFTNLYLGNSTNGYFNINVRATDYYDTTTRAEVLAGQTVARDILVAHNKYGYLIGTIRDAETGLPISGASGGFFLNSTGPDGRYATQPFILPSYSQQSARFSFSVTASGYWGGLLESTIAAGQTNLVDLELLRVCTGATIVGSVVNALNQQPISGATVRTDQRSTLTDAKGNFVLTNLTVGTSNSPIKTTVTASAPGYNTQSRTVTIFCGATIISEFGQPPTQFGSLEGWVTNSLTGQPLASVFIGSEFGGATTTDPQGHYTLSQVPLSVNGADRTWRITAMPTGFSAQTKPVVVTSNAVARLDFDFGAAFTDLEVLLQDTPDPVTAGSNLIYTVTIHNNGGAAANVRITSSLPPGVQFAGAAITNSSAPGFTTPVFHAGAVSTTISNFPGGAAAMLQITVQPSVAGWLTNTATVTTDTPDTVSGNNSASAATRVNPPGLAGADLAIRLSGSPAVVLASNLWTISMRVSNAGPAAATSVVVSNQLPPGATFISSTPGSVPVNGLLLLSLGDLAAGAASNVVVVVRAEAAGALTCQAAASSAQPDPNPADNTASASVLVQTPSVPTSLAWTLIGPIYFNPQTGLFEQGVRLANPGVADAPGARLLLPGLPADVKVYNGTGITNGTPFVAVSQTIPAGGSLDLILEFYRPSRQGFGPPALTLEAASPSPPQPSTGNAIQLDREPQMIGDRFLIEFAAVPGRAYLIQYSADASTWTDAVPPVVAGGTRVQWFDDGPPKTSAKPVAVGSRIYRVIELPR